MRAALELQPWLKTMRVNLHQMTSDVGFNVTALLNIHWSLKMVRTVLF